MEKNLSTSLRYIIQELEKTVHPNEIDVRKLLIESELSSSDIKKYARFYHAPEFSYDRQVIYEGKHFIILSVSWAAGDFTAIHNHGETQWGAIFFTGNTEHRSYETNFHSIRLQKSEIIPQGTIVNITGDYTHAMGNLSDTPFQTLHIYGTGLADRKPGKGSIVYMPEYNLFCRSQGAAYLNINGDLCSDRNYGIHTDHNTIIDYFTNIRPYYRRIKSHELVKLIDQVLLDPEIYFRMFKANPIQV